jgi:transposase
MPRTGELQWFGVGGDVGEAAGLCAGLSRPVRAAYEGGSTGYGLARELQRRGVDCVVAAPSKIPRACGDRVKTDRRDAELLVRLLLAGELHPVRVPGAEEEALRDLVRAREAVRVDLMRCRHRLSGCFCAAACVSTTGVRGRTATARGWPASSWTGPRHRPRCWM